MPSPDVLSTDISIVRISYGAIYLQMTFTVIAAPCFPVPLLFFPSPSYTDNSDLKAVCCGPAVHKSIKDAVLDPHLNWTLQGTAKKTWLSLALPRVSVPQHREDQNLMGNPQATLFRSSDPS